MPLSLVLCIWATKKIFFAFCSKDSNSCATSRRRRAYQQGESLVYHQHEVLNIIKPQENARWRVMRYSPVGADDIHDCVAMICQASGLDKKFDKSKLVEFFGRGDGIRTHDFYVPNVALYQTEPHLGKCKMRNAEWMKGHGRTCAPSLLHHDSISFFSWFVNLFCKNIFGFGEGGMIFLR